MINKHISRLSINDTDSPRWIGTEAYKRMLLVDTDLRFHVTSLQIGFGSPDKESKVKYKDGLVVIYFNSGTGVVFVQLKDEAEDEDKGSDQIGPQAISMPGEHSNLKLWSLTNDIKALFPDLYQVVNEFRDQASDERDINLLGTVNSLGEIIEFLKEQI